MDGANARSIYGLCTPYGVQYIQPCHMMYLKREGPSRRDICSTGTLCQLRVPTVSDGPCTVEQGLRQTCGPATVASQSSNVVDVVGLPCHYDFYPKPAMISPQPLAYHLSGRSSTTHDPSVIIGERRSVHAPYSIQPHHLTPHESALGGGVHTQSATAIYHYLGSHHIVPSIRLDTVANSTRLSGRK